MSRAKGGSLLVLVSPMLRLFRPKKFHCSVISQYRSVQTVSSSHAVYEPVNRNSTSGPPFLITHGLLGSKQNWNSIAKVVARDTNRKVIVFDARNHGDSPRTEEHSYDLMATDVLDFTKQLGVDKVAIMGHSMGGRTVMAFALRNPHLVEKLVVVDVSPVSMTALFSEMKGYLEALLRISFDENPNITLSEARKQANEALIPVVKDAAVRAFLMTNLAEANNGKIYWKANVAVLLKDLEKIKEFPQDLLTKSLDAPTLFIRGQKSPYIPDQDIPKLKKIFPHSQVNTINGAGHWPHAEKVNDFLGSLLPFLKS